MGCLIGSEKGFRVIAVQAGHPAQAAACDGLLSAARVLSSNMCTNSGIYNGENAYH